MTKRKTAPSWGRFFILKDWFVIDFGRRRGMLSLK